MSATETSDTLGSFQDFAQLHPDLPEPQAVQIYSGILARHWQENPDSRAHASRLATATDFNLGYLSITTYEENQDGSQA